MKKCLIVSTVSRQFTLFERGNIEVLKELGYEIHCAANFIDETEELNELPIIRHEIDIQRSPFSFKNIKAYKQLRKIIKSNKFDLIHCHSPMGGVLTRLAARKTRKNETKVVYTAHGFHFFKGAPLINWILYYPVEKYLSKYTDCLITINNEDFNIASKKFKARRVELINGIGVDKDKFNFEISKEEKHELRASIGLNDDDLVIIYVAELSKRKNQIMLLKAIKELKKQGINNVKVLLPGKDSLNGKYQKYVKKNNLEDKIKFLGFRNDIPKLMKISDLCISTSKQEGLPVNIMEAMMCELPIIATNCRGNRDLIENINIININDIKELEKNILKFCNNERNLCSYKVEKYLKENVKKEIKKIYNNVTKKKVIHILASNKFSGAENVVISIIKNLNSNIECFYASPKGPIQEVLKNEKINYIPIKKLSVKEINKIVKKYNPDVIHAHDFRASIICSMVSFKGKLISQIHQTPTFLKTWNLKSILYYWSTKRYQKIIGVTNAILDNCIFSKKIKEKYITIFNCVNKDKIIKDALKEQIKESYDLAFIGRLENVKNPIRFLQIVKDIKDEGIGITAIMIGNGSLMDDCKKYICDNNMEKNVKMSGFEKNPFPILIKTKIILSTSIWEGIPMTMLESGALKRPILNNGVGGLEEIFSKMKYMICKTDDEYKEKIKILLNNNDVYRECQRQIEINLERFYNMDEYIKKFEKVYEE